jgi:tRNA(Arg) A34 adenosine deaminase TadA
MPNETELQHLGRCVDLATEALVAGEEPFGSMLVGAEGAVLFEDHNRVASGDATRHPEFELARWASTNMGPEERAAATVFTSTEHCPMCAAAHGWVGLGRIMFASSSKQVSSWRAELGAPASPVRPLAIQEVVPDLAVEGPVPHLAERVRDLCRRFYALDERRTSDVGTSDSGPMSI